ncbi:hypothetical protein A2230_03445 [candidate division WOR-1 bacterium RIFOXYA2_FULL_36_21]|uniref:Dihydroorotate dehydrogenase B (NAD(+)), electron transfer subunit n=1 Tax=candidate division WOR-1 bacterium RIFOXYB2_FULL_36_35 TaxID=1802578 RepID=A0A1F4S149_UNCSA|nr:MAG: hypothetical protein A2230_03445 [candidate division WOR-1 bacterium RIFOXYA2_FULL_36_21]OGC14152.1 MAG: hypothetical protein A2290_00555 [candidate division WOR-1 bacterium RIFOXYB2_FULL_36_35]OGC15374.1 MAG: hypothetical protein A2282_01545 [candidate division WOR-1 bacterium RIFOXYA12_FULL_36_13]
MRQEKVKIVAHKHIAPHFFKLTLQSKHIAENALPGQFVNVRVSTETSPLLRRPISIHKINRQNQTIELLYEIIGKGTTILSQKKEGETINILGPLGKGFSVRSDKTSAILVGGGMGIAPLFALAEVLIKNPIDVNVLIGAKSKRLIICESDLTTLGIKVKTSTEDGSCGTKGLVSDILQNLIKALTDKQSASIFACGPKAMLKAVSEIAIKENIPCQLSLEAYMACGIGACKGCAVSTISGYKMACKDGPVFDSKEIIWN